jgi:hypothetical protein
MNGKLLTRCMRCRAEAGKYLRPCKVGRAGRGGLEWTVDRRLSRLIAWVLRRWTSLDVRDYTTLLGLTSGYGVLEMTVDADSWMAHKRLDEL